MARTPKAKKVVAETTKDITKAAAPAARDAKLSVAKVKEQASALGAEALDSARKAANQGKEMAAEALDEISRLAASAASVVDKGAGRIICRSPGSPIFPARSIYFPLRSHHSIPKCGNSVRADNCTI